MAGNDNEPGPVPPLPRSRENGHIPPAFYARALGDAPEIVVLGQVCQAVKGQDVHVTVAALPLRDHKRIIQELPDAHLWPIRKEKKISLEFVVYCRILEETEQPRVNLYEFVSVGLINGHLRMWADDELRDVLMKRHSAV